MRTLRHFGLMVAVACALYVAIIAAGTLERVLR